MQKKVPDFIERSRESNKGILYSQSYNVYFEFIRNIYRASAKKHYPKMIEYCVLSYGLIEPLLLHYKTLNIIDRMLTEDQNKYFSEDSKNPERAAEKEFISRYPNLSANDEVEGMIAFDIRYIPAITISGEYFAVMGLEGDLKNLREIVLYFNDLKIYRQDITKFEQIYDLSKNAKRIIKDKPGISERELLKELVYDTDENIELSLYLMEKYGVIEKREGYYLPDKKD